MTLPQTYDNWQPPFRIKIFPNENFYCSKLKDFVQDNFKLNENRSKDLQKGLNHYHTMPRFDAQKMHVYSWEKL